MRVGFAGTPEFAARILAALIEAGHTIPVCLTQPDRPKGRGMRATASPVKAVAERHRIPIRQPASFKAADDREALGAIPLDVLVVAAYGLLLPPSVLAWPRHGCLNVHASLLPRWRGAAPIQRAIEAGDAVTGVTIMQMDAGLDTGPAVSKTEVAIDPVETAGSLSIKLADAGAGAILGALQRLAQERVLTSVSQPNLGASYARKVDPAEAHVRWNAPALALERKLRAFDPVPGAYAWLDGERIKLWRASVVDARNAALEPGCILVAGPNWIDIACGKGVLRILELQPPGRRRMTAADFLAGRTLHPGTRFSSDPPHDSAR
jgi:methionyl-tRNA formyltransferase